MLTMIAVVTLLLTSCGLTGLLSVWAANSAHHWAIRAGSFVASFATLLLIPAYEPFVMFITQGATVAAGLQLARWRGWIRWHHETGKRNQRLSILACLLGTVFVAIAIAVSMHVPSIGLEAWLNVWMLGLFSGITTLIGVSFVALRFPVGSGVSA